MTMARRLLAIVALVASGCSLAIRTDDLHPVDALPAAADAADAAGQPDTQLNCPPSTAPCPKASAGRPLVRVGCFCIDATEVTEQDYAQFFEAAQINMPTLPAGCEYKTAAGLRPSAANPGPGYPARGVDWCDAAAYCAWAGKRLCGRVGTGGSIGSLEPWASELQWACSAAGQRRYPYGSEFRAGACADDTKFRIVGSPGCEGGYTGVFDLSGNVAEWENGCQSTSPDAECRTRGGSVYNGEGALQCTTNTMVARKSKLGPVGFRCCAS